MVKQPRQEKQTRVYRSRNKPTEFISFTEKSILQLIYTRPISWHQIYCLEFDALFKQKLLEWDHIDARGEYFNTVKITDLGRQKYNEYVIEMEQNVIK